MSGFLRFAGSLKVCSVCVAVARALLSLRRVYLDRPIATPFPTDGHLVFFLFLATMKKAATNILFRSFCGECHHFGGMVGNGALGHRAGACLVL